MTSHYRKVVYNAHHKHRSERGRHDALAAAAIAIAQANISKHTTSTSKFRQTDGQTRQNQVPNKCLRLRIQVSLGLHPAEGAVSERTSKRYFIKGRDIGDPRRQIAHNTNVTNTTHRSNNSLLLVLSGPDMPKSPSDRGPERNEEFQFGN